MEAWREVWRLGVAPNLSLPGLHALRRALLVDDGRLVQGATTVPPPLMRVLDWPVEAACPIGFAGWQGDKIELVGPVEEYFARVCYLCDQAIGEPAACRFFLNFFDNNPRSEACRELLAEVNLALAQRDPEFVTA